MSELRYTSRITGCTILGPHRRAVIWVHGCCFSCPGCIASGFHAQSPHILSADAMADWFLSLPDVEGLTISGGEPMLQAAALSDMLDRIRSQRDAGVIVYTGFTHEALPARKDKGIDRLLAHTDLLIDGPYIREQDQGDYARGSANQRLLNLSSRYLSDMDYYRQTKRDMQIRIYDDHLLMVGVPSATQANTWQALKDQLTP